MCGRFTLTSDEDEIITRFEVQDTFRDTRLVPRFNIAPSQQVAVVVSKGGRRVLDTYKWGLIPFWVKDLKKMKPMINARCETLMEKPFFKTALSRRRCVIPADGFYEWKQEAAAGVKSPVWIHFGGGKLFGLAGLWDEWRSPDGEVIRTCTIITTAANSAMSPIHDRMPVILLPDAESLWLDESVTDPARLLQVARPCADNLLQMRTVSTRVNSPKTDSSDLILEAPQAV